MRFLLLITVLLCPFAAHAADVGGSVKVLSDYRDRGVSQSGNDPAIQGNLEAWFDNGFAVGAWASSLKNAPGGDGEFNLYASYTHDWGAVGFWTLGAQYVTFSGEKDTGYGEVYGTLGVDYGFAVATLNMTYTPDRDDLEGGDNLYTNVRVDANWPTKPYGVSLSTGFDYFKNRADKWDWSAGVFYQFKDFTLTVDYIDTDQGGVRSGSTVVGALKLSF